MPMSKRIRSSSPTPTTENCSSPSAISRYISHDSYLTFIPPSSSSSEQRLTNTNLSNIDTDLIDDAMWDDWDMPSTVTKKTPGKIRTMSSPAVHSRINEIIEPTKIVINVPETTIDTATCKSMFSSLSTIFVSLSISFSSINRIISATSDTKNSLG
jgi:hypothetical protein